MLHDIDGHLQGSDAGTAASSGGLEACLDEDERVK